MASLSDAVDPLDKQIRSGLGALMRRAIVSRSCWVASPARRETWCWPRPGLPAGLLMAVIMAGATAGALGQLVDALSR